MKKAALTLLISFISINAHSQILDIRGHGGIGLISVTADSKTNVFNGETYSHTVTSAPLIQFGVATTIGKRFFLQPGITWQSVVLTNTNINDVTQAEFNDEVELSMITVPLKVGVRIINPEDLKLVNFRVFGGIDGQFVTAVDHTTKSGLVPDYKKEDFNKMITYMDLGMGLDVLFLFTDLGYRIGLSPVLNSGDNSKANMFYANVGIKLKL